MTDIYLYGFKLEQPEQSVQKCADRVDKSSTRSDKLAEIHEQAVEVCDLLAALDLIGDGIGAEEGFAVSAVALAAKSVAENVRHSLSVLAHTHARDPREAETNG